MQLNRLEGFYWVGKTGGYAAAARAMPYPITQPAVYQQVKRLEEELEVTLFERVAHGTMRLTRAGQTLHDFIAPFFVGFPAAVRATQASQSGGVLRIHAAHQVVRELLPRWVAALLAERPGAQVEIVEQDTPDVELLRQGKSDLLIDYMREAPPDDIGAHKVAINYGFLIVPAAITPEAPSTSTPPPDAPTPRSPNTRDTESVDLDEASLALIDGLPFVAYNRHLDHHQLQREALRHFGLDPGIAAYVERAECILEMVAAGVGFSFIPSLRERGPDHPGVHATPIDLDDARFPVMALWRQNGPPHPLVDLMLSLPPFSAADLTSS